MIRQILVLLFLAFLGYVLWPYDVLQLDHHNPATTAIIQRRIEEATLAGHTLKPRMVWKDLKQISPHLVHVIVLSEDDTFYQHHGFDLEQIQIAIQRDWAKHKYAYGGSTITQQLARTLYLRPRKSVLRKLKEAVLTVYLERLLTKKRILELYLNVVEWGPGVFGAEAAAHYYFHKPALDLTPDEAVSLASILPSPRRWSPFSEKAFMARRRTQLMDRMQKAGYVAPPENLPSDGTFSNPFDPQGRFDAVQSSASVPSPDPETELPPAE